MKRLPVFLIVFLTLVAANVSAGTKEAATEDYTARVRELTPLADGGNALAQLQMGLILRSGLGGIPKDPERAFDYLLKAAEQDQWNAQYSVAGMYAEGWGVPKNQVSALRWASIAAGRGSETALSMAEELRSALDQTSRQKAQSMADQWSQATLIDGRPAKEYNVKCVVLQVQIDEAKDFMDKVKTEADAKELISAAGAMKWSSLGIIYPSGTVALSDVTRRYRGLLDIKSSKKCL